MKDYLEQGGLDLSQALAARKLSAEEVMRATLDRVAVANGEVNAIVSLRDEEALIAEARAADNAPRRGWLHGIPMAVKDLADAAGLPTSHGSPLYAGQIAARDEPMVARLRRAGAIIIGKTNTPAFGLGSHTFNPVFGATRNPYDPSRSAGGSSGGAAAALAARMLCLADGSDMMGSLRNPAAWNNVYGMRPTWGLVPSGDQGEVFLGQLSTAGPMARTPRDLAALLDTMAGCSAPYGRAFSPTLPGLDHPSSAPRIGWLGDWDGAFPMTEGLETFCRDALAEASTLGWRMETLAAPFPAEEIWRAWVDLRSFVIAGNRRGDYSDLTRRGTMNMPLIWEIEHGQALGAADVFRASEIRSDWYRRALALFESFDALALPAAQLWPFPVEELHPTEIAGRKMDTYHRWMEVVVPVSLIGLPAVCLPVGFNAQGLPMGVQLIGAPGTDGRLLRLAQSWHEMTEWPQRRPAG